MLNFVLKKLFLVLTILCENKEFGDVRRLDFLTGSKLPLPLTKSGESDIAKILKLYETGGREEASKSSCSSCQRISPFLHLLLLGLETVDTGSKPEQGRGQTSKSQHKQV